MFWFNTWSTAENIFVILFVLCYAVYLTRAVLMAKKYKFLISSFLKKFVIRSIYFSLILIAILGPTIGDSKQNVAVIGKDIYIAIDLSLSMYAADIAPNRLEVGKQFILELIKDVSVNDRISLIVFGSDAYTLCPLTYDHQSLEIYLSSLNSLTDLQKGSDINSVFSILLQKKQLVTKEKNEKKVLLILSDGEFSEPAAGNLLMDVGKQFICYNLALGTSEGSNIVYQNRVKKDEKGKQVITKLNLENLDNIAKRTSGKTIVLKDIITAKQKTIYETNQLKQYARGTQKREAMANKYTYILLLALLLISLDRLIALDLIKI